MLKYRLIRCSAVGSTSLPLSGPHSASFRTGYLRYLRSWSLWSITTTEDQRKCAGTSAVCSTRNPTTILGGRQSLIRSDFIDLASIREKVHMNQSSPASPLGLRLSSNLVIDACPLQQTTRLKDHGHREPPSRGFPQSRRGTNVFGR